MKGTCNTSTHLKFDWLPGLVRSILIGCQSDSMNIINRKLKLRIGIILPWRKEKKDARTTEKQKRVRSQTTENFAISIDTPGHIMRPRVRGVN